jgi:hypothetical protein
MACVIRSAYLRVYLPRERAGRWPPHTPPRRTRRTIRASDHFVWEESTRDDAFTTEWNGGVYVCPRYPKLRMLEGVLAFRNAYGGLSEMLIPERALRAAVEELADIRSSSPEARSHILSSPWHVPIRWFIAFDAADREVVRKPAGLTVRYLSELGDALDRVTDAVDVLEDAGFDESVVEPVGELADWLSEFSGDALLELDYGGVAGLFTEVDLAMDESAAEIHSALQALEEGNVRQAGMLYANIAGRWAPMQAITYVN